MEEQDRLAELAMRGEQSGLAQETQEYIAAKHLASLFNGIWDVQELNHDGNHVRRYQPRRGYFSGNLRGYDNWLDL
jgi:hypothetical protein